LKFDGVEVPKRQRFGGRPFFYDFVITFDTLKKYDKNFSSFSAENLSKFLDKKENSLRVEKS